MGVLKDCIENKDFTSIPVWFMRQAGRYLPEFREIRKRNNNFIDLCLNPIVSKEITLQPLKRFSVDAAIIFSDILLIPHALGQSVEFKRGFGPQLGELEINKVLEIPDSDILNKLNPVYDLIKITSKDEILKGKDLIGFVGGTWTLLVYMLNRQSPKKLNDNIFLYSNKKQLIQKIINTQKLHIKKQVDSGASVIQIFDSWAGLLNNDKLEEFIYQPTLEILEYTRKLGVQTICFPRGIENYKQYCDIIKPNAINIDYEVDPKTISENIEIPIQGGMDPKCLLLDKNEMLNKAKEYLEIFKNHKYIFNLGHGVMPETEPENLKILVDFIKDYR